MKNWLLFLVVCLCCQNVSAQNNVDSLLVGTWLYDVNEGNQQQGNLKNIIRYSFTLAGDVFYSNIGSTQSRAVGQSEFCRVGKYKIVGDSLKMKFNRCYVFSWNTGFSRKTIDEVEEMYEVKVETNTLYRNKGYIRIAQTSIVSFTGNYPIIETQLISPENKFSYSNTPFVFKKIDDSQSILEAICSLTVSWENIISDFCK